MNTNRHDDAAARPVSRPVPGSEPAAGTGLITRHRLVAGVFTNPLEAGDAIVTLAAGGAEHCALVLLSRGPDGRSSSSERPPGTNFAVHHIDASAPLLPRLAEILARETQDSAAAGMQRLIQRLAQHLSDGSAVVVCATRAADQQRLVSQTFLEARCKVVLTHEDERGGCRPGPASDACCGACGSPCDRESGS